MTTPFAATMPDDSVDIKDFTIKRKRIRFRMDDDVFEAHAVLGLAQMQSMVRVSKNMSQLVSDEKFDAIFNVFDELLKPESAQRFRERAFSTGDDAIDVREQIIPILHYLLEAYGLRPTQPSSDSLSGSLNAIDGTTSTVGSSIAVNDSSI